MIEWTMPTGGSGTLILDDQTDGFSKTVDVFIQSSTPIAIPQLPWAYAIDDQFHNWRQYDFKPVLTRQYLGPIYVGAALTFTLFLGPTGTSQLGGPVNMPIDLFSKNVESALIKVGIAYKRAIPYVNVDGTWKRAVALCNSGGTWQKVN